MNSPLTRERTFLNYYGSLWIQLLLNWWNNLKMFHQCSIKISCSEKSKSPVISWITGLGFLGCPDGLEPSTFRTTSRVSNIWNPLYLSAFPQILIFILRLFCGYLRKNRFFFNNSRNLLMQNRRFTLEPIIVIIKTNYYLIWLQK